MCRVSFEDCSSPVPLSIFEIRQRTERKFSISNVCLPCCKHRAECNCAVRASVNWISWESCQRASFTRCCCWQTRFVVSCDPPRWHLKDLNPNREVTSQFNPAAELLCSFCSRQPFPGIFDSYPHSSPTRVTLTETVTDSGYEEASLRQFFTRARPKFVRG